MKEHHVSVKRRFGWLKNGNPPGDPSQAPRCGAKAKKAQMPCLAPAMKNGRCRLHGGKSTGPKTPQGLENSRNANWKTGDYSAEARAERREISKLLQESKKTIKVVKEIVS